MGTVETELGLTMKSLLVLSVVSMAAAAPPPLRLQASCQEDRAPAFVPQRIRLPRALCLSFTRVFAERTPSKDDSSPHQVRMCCGFFGQQIRQIDFFCNPLKL